MTTPPRATVTAGCGTAGGWPGPTGWGVPNPAAVGPAALSWRSALRSIPPGRRGRSGSHPNRGSTSWPNNSTARLESWLSMPGHWQRNISSWMPNSWYFLISSAHSSGLPMMNRPSSTCSKGTSIRSAAGSSWLWPEAARSWYSHSTWGRAISIAFSRVSAMNISRQADM